MSDWGGMNVWAIELKDGSFHLQPSPVSEDVLDDLLLEIKGRMKDAFDFEWGNRSQLPNREAEIPGYVLSKASFQVVGQHSFDFDLHVVSSIEDIPVFMTREKLEPLLQDHHVARACGCITAFSIPEVEMRRILLEDIERPGGGSRSAVSRLVRWYPESGNGMDTADREYVLDAVAYDLTEGKHGWPMNSDPDEMIHNIVDAATSRGWLDMPKTPRV